MKNGDTPWWKRISPQKLREMEEKEKGSGMRLIEEIEREQKRDNDEELRQVKSHFRRQIVVMALGLVFCAAMTFATVWVVERINPWLGASIAVVLVVAVAAAWLAMENRHKSFTAKALRKQKDDWGEE